MSLSPTEEAAAILNHYFAQLARAGGLRWTERNAGDIERAAELLMQVDKEPVGDEIPPYQRPIQSDRVTEVFERHPFEVTADEVRRRRYDEADDVRRLVRHGGGR